MSSLKSADTLPELEVTSVAPIMADAYWRALKAEAEGRIGGLRHALRDKQQLLDTMPVVIEWHDLSYAEQNEPGSAPEVYAHIKQLARDHLESGQRAAEIVASELMRPWIKASYLALRESFIADWKPTGSIEVRLIEMMAQLYTSYEHWMALSVQRVAFDHEQEHYKIKERTSGESRPCPEMRRRIKQQTWQIDSIVCSCAHCASYATCVATICR